VSLETIVILLIIVLLVLAIAGYIRR